MALASAILFDEARGRQRTIEHYRKLERERILRVRRLHNQVERQPSGGRGSFDRYLESKNQRAA